MSEHHLGLLAGGLQRDLDGLFCIGGLVGSFCDLHHQSGALVGGGELGGPGLDPCLQLGVQELDLPSSGDQPLLTRQLVACTLDHARQPVEEMLILDEVVACAELHRRHRHPLVALTSHDNERRTVTLLGEGLDEARAEHVRQRVVQQHQRRRVREDLADALCSAVCGNHLEAPAREHVAHHHVQTWIILDHKHQTML